MNRAFYIREIILSVKRYKSASLKMFALCFICSLTLTFTVSFGLSLKQDMKTIVDNKMSLCRNTLLLGEEQTDITNTIGEEYLLTSELVKGDFYGKSIDEFTIEYDGIVHSGVNDYTYDFAVTDIITRELCSVNFNIAAISAGSTLFSKADGQELRSVPQSAGSVPKGEREIMISDYYLEKFGIGKDNIIGKSISVYYQNDCIMKDYKVCGVIDSDIFFLHGKKNYSQIYVSDKDPMNRFSSASKKLCVYSRDFPQAVKKRDELISQNYTLEENNAVVLYSAIFTEQNLIIKSFGSLCAALLITTVIVLSGMLKNNMTARLGYFIMLKNMGVRSNELTRLLLAEFTVKTVPPAFMGALSSYPLLLLAQNLTYFALAQQITLSALTVALSAVCNTLLFGLISLSGTAAAYGSLRNDDC